MSDLIFISMIIVFFLAAVAFAKGCQQLRGASDD
jgi:hypothetical protein